jgi:hypothetical protein
VSRDWEGELRNRKIAMAMPSCCHFNLAAFQMLLSGSRSFKSRVDTAMIYPIPMQIWYGLEKGKHARHCEFTSICQIRKQPNIFA